MKYRLFSVFLCLGLLLSMAGCGNETASTPESTAAAATTPEAFGDMSLAEAPVEEAETTTLPASAPEAALSQPEAEISVSEAAVST